MGLRIGSLCTGYAGLDMAVERVFGGEMVWYSEFEKHPSTLLAQRFPGVPNLGDMTMIDWNLLVGRAPDLETTHRMYDLYCQGLSLDQVAAREGVTRQTVFTRFKRRGLDLRPRPPAMEFISYAGRKYTLGVNGYYRATEGDREYLHRAVYRREVGEIPSGWEVHHIDHDKTHNVVSNFDCLSKADHARLHGGDANDSFSVDILTGGYP